MVCLGEVRFGMVWIFLINKKEGILNARIIFPNGTFYSASMGSLHGLKVAEVM